MVWFATIFRVSCGGITGRFFDELKRRNVVRVAIAYVIFGWLVIALGYFVWDRQQLIDAATPAAEPVAKTDAPPPDAESLSATQPAEADTKRRSIAVLPFVNMSSDAEQEWFVDGLTEELLNSLARTPDLLVAARTSSFNYKDSDKNIPEIAKALGVEHILEGSVRRSGDRLRVTAQLIRADDGFHLWSESYDRTMDDVIQIQEEVAIQIANALETAMDPEALARMVSAGTSSVPAYEAYLQGLTFGVSSIASGDIYEFLDAREAYERAIELDPEFVLAHRRLASFWRLQMTTSNISHGLTDLPVTEIRDQYAKAIGNALRYERDPVRRIAYQADKAAAEVKYLHALRLNTTYLEQRPNDHDAQNLQLAILQSLGRYVAATQQVAEFYERDGYHPIVTVRSILALLYSDQPELLREFAKKSVERFADNVNVLYQAHRALLWTGDIDGASQILSLVQASDMEADNRALATLRQACAEGKNALGQRIFEQILRDYPDETSAVWLSYMIMGRNEEAVEMLRAFDNDDNMTALASFFIDGQFDARNYPNFLSLLEGQGIEPHALKPVPHRCET